MGSKTGFSKRGLELQIDHYLVTLGQLDMLDIEYGEAGRDARAQGRLSTQRLLDECVAELKAMEAE